MTDLFVSFWCACRTGTSRRQAVMFVLLAMITLLIPSISYSYMIDVDISDVTFIYNEKGEFRVLLKFETPDIPDSFRIDFASVILPKCEDTPEVQLEIHSLSPPWVASTVGWNYPWENEGSDFSEAVVSRWTIQSGVGARGHFMDMTEYVRSIVKRGGNYGLILVPASDNGAGFRPDAASVFAGLGAVKLRVL